MNWTNYCKRIACAILLSGAISGCSEDMLPALQVGVQAPTFTADLLDGKTISSSDYQGKGLILFFMSSWCPCSNESIPIVNEAYHRHKGEKIEFLMIGIQEAKSNFESFVKQRGVAFPAIYDGDKLISRSYGINAPPSMVFIDKQGKVRRVFYGNVKDKKKEFVKWIEDII